MDWPDLIGSDPSKIDWKMVSLLGSKSINLISIFLPTPFRSFLCGIRTQDEWKCFAYFKLVDGLVSGLLNRLTSTRPGHIPPFGPSVSMCARGFESIQPRRSRLTRHTHYNSLLRLPSHPSLMKIIHRSIVLAGSWKISIFYKAVSLFAGSRIKIFFCRLS